MSGRAIAAVEHFGLSRRESTRQISGFVTYVSGAHSWYKHLPMARDGVFFRFRLDLTARLRHNEEGFSPYVRGDGTSAQHNNPSLSLGTDDAGTSDQMIRRKVRFRKLRGR